jgi:membrane protein implicated in regulation of membrane protease activity
MNKPRPSAVTLATGITVSLAAGFLSLLGGAWVWIALAVAAVGAYQTVTGLYRLASAVDYIAARPVVRRTVTLPVDAGSTTP